MAIEKETALAQVPLVVHFSLPPFCYLQHYYIMMLLALYRLMPTFYTEITKSAVSVWTRIDIA